MTMSRMLSSAERAIRSNSPTIFTALGVSGVVVTAYLTGKASFKAAEVIRLAESPLKGASSDRKQRVKERTSLVWRLYIPAAVSGAASVACIVAAQKAGSRKTAAAQAAFSLSERAYSEYKDKVVETIGETKEQKIRDEIAQDRVNRHEAPPHEVLFSGPGNILCQEAYTGRYITSDHESLRKAQNDINAKLVAHTYAYLDDLYYIVGLEHTSLSGQLGWESDKLLSLEFYSALTKDNRPVLVFEYNYVKQL